MGLKIEIQDATRAAMKKGDRLTLSILRLLLSALQNEEIKSRRELSTEEIRRTISTLCKQRTEAIELFRKGAREELAQKEEAELKVLQHFLPQQLSENEVRALIQSSIEEIGAKNVQDLGKVMKQVMPRVSGRADGKRVNELAKEILAG
ncbi:MAG: GatB/YqeY domain-containing protein [Candidatus Binatia bacterium]